jgi:hypothetical protein
MYSQELKDKVAKSRSWKLSNIECARRIGITLDEYLKIKKSLGFKSKKLIYTKDPNTEKLNSESYDLENGTGKIEKLVSFNPRTPEEIIQILGINTEEWKLSQYWNKEKNDKWLVSALVTRVVKTKEDHLKDILDNFKPNYQPVTVKKQKRHRYVSCVLSMQDMHIGKDGNDDIIEQYFASLEQLTESVSNNYFIDDLVYVIGGDILNMDTFSGTTTAGTPVENSDKAYNVYAEAFDALYRGIRFLKERCETLHIMFIPGNHDRLSSYHLVHALSKAIQEESIVWHSDYAERKVLTFSNNFFAFEHGDVNTKNSLLVYATEFSEQWGNSKFRTLYTGHYHKKKTIEYITEDEITGFSIKIIPSLSKTDYWHYHNKFIGSKRAAIIEVHDYDNGKIGEFVYNCI